MVSSQIRFIPSGCSCGNVAGQSSISEEVLMKTLRPHGWGPPPGFGAASPDLAPLRGSSVSFYLSEYSQAVKPTLEEPAPHNSPPRDPGAHAPVRNCTGAPGTTSRSESSALALLLSKRRLLRTGILAVLLSFVVKLIKTLGN